MCKYKLEAAGQSRSSAAEALTSHNPSRNKAIPPTVFFSHQGRILP